MNHLSEEILLNFIDEDVSEELKKEIQNHLSICNSCRNKLTELQKADQLFSNINEYETPVKLNERVMYKISRKRKNEKQQKNVFVFIISFLTIVLISSITIIVSSTNLQFDKIFEFSNFTNNFLNEMKKISSIFINKISENNTLIIYTSLLILIVSIFLLIEELNNQKIRHNSLK